MTYSLPHTSALNQKLKESDALVVLCFCAAWCDACKEYQPKFSALADRHANACFVWIDIEDYPELLGDEDVENFPTIAIVQDQAVRFMGTMLPHIEHLERLMTALSSPGKAQVTHLPKNLLAMLKAAV